MAKLTLTDESSGFQTTAQRNANYALIEAALENTLSRDGTTPNTMSASLDMNSNKILNLGAPQASSDAARWLDVTSALAISTAMPNQTGNAGRVAMTDGSAIAWSSVKIVVDSIAELKAIAALADKELVATLGYYTAGDGGEGTYLYDSASAATADDFKVIDPTTVSGRFLLQPCAGWYNALQAGVKRDGTATSTRFQAFLTGLSSGDKALVPKPATGSFYNLDAAIELKDKEGITLIGPGAIDVAQPGHIDPMKYTGTTLTGVYNAVFKVCGVSFSTIKDFMVNCDSKTDTGFWFSGTNNFTGSETASRVRSTSNNLESIYIRGVNKRAIVIGEDEAGNSSQTDLLNMVRLKGSAGETGAAYDTTPVTYGMCILGLNTYVIGIHCETTGDVGYYYTGNAEMHHPYCLNNDVAGHAIDSSNVVITLIKPYMEGVDGRPVQTYIGTPSNSESQGAKPITIIGMQAYPGGGSSYEASFTTNAPITIQNSFLKGWRTDNYAGAYEKPVYTMFGNKYFGPATDYTNNTNIVGSECSVDYSTSYKFIMWSHGRKVATVDYTSGPSTIADKTSELNVIAVNSGSGNTITLPDAVKGLGPIRIFRLGSGTCVVNAQAGDTIQRHDTGAAATTDARLATASQYGYIEFNCLVDGQWWPTSSLTITYT